MNRIIEWFKGGDPEGRAKIRRWATGTEGNAGYTYGTHYVVTGLMLAGGVGYLLSPYILLVALGMCIIIMGGRRMLENQVRRDISDLEEAKRQFMRTRNKDYLEFMRLRTEQMLRDNRMLRPETVQLVNDHLDWARRKQRK